MWQATSSPPAESFSWEVKHADILGRRRVFLAALAALIGLSLLGGFAISGEVLVASCFPKGLAAAFDAETAMSPVTASFAPGSSTRRTWSRPAPQAGR